MVLKSHLIPAPALDCGYHLKSRVNRSLLLTTLTARSHSIRTAPSVVSSTLGIHAKSMKSRWCWYYFRRPLSLKSWYTLVHSTCDTGKEYWDFLQFCFLLLTHAYCVPISLNVNFYCTLVWFAVQEAFFLLF